MRISAFAAQNDGDFSTDPFIVRITRECIR
jgi:hypothetical protein